MNRLTTSKAPRSSRWALIRPRLRSQLGTSESLRIERVISMARLLLTTIAVIQLRLDPIEPIEYAPLALATLILFTAHAVSALVVLRITQRTSRGFTLTTMVADLLGAVMTLPLAAPTNSFFVFFLFVLATTAFRWGLRETIAMTFGTIGLVILYANFADQVPLLSAIHQYSFDRMIGRTAYLAMIGLLLGYLAEEGRLLRAESGALASLLGKIRVDAGIVRAVSAVANEVIDLCNASHLMLVIDDRNTQQLFRWDTAGGWSVEPSGENIAPAMVDAQPYLFSPADQSLGILHHRLPVLTGKFSGVRVDPSGRVIDIPIPRVPPEFVTAHPFRRLIVVPVSFGDEWSGRLFLFDPRLEVRLTSLVQFLQTLVRHISPALFGVHLLNQLQARAGALERARVARELHDGVIQSLIGVEMQLDVLHRQPPFHETPAAAELARLQQLVRSEVLNLRELMQQMRPPEFDPDELLDYLADMVQKFGRDTGIAAVFLSELKNVSLPWRVCFELVRIVQEGLVNVRKHSAATAVVVRFGFRDGHWALEINDNGRGFPFEGRLLHADLDMKWRGPTIIKERVKAIGGHLAIDSTPGRGTRLEVLVPQEARG